MKGYLHSIAGLWLLVLSCCLSTPSRAQSCFNIGFEDSSFVNWEGFTGQYADTILNAGFIPGRHMIMHGDARDTLTDTVVSKVAPGSQYSVRLGNRFTGAQQDRLRYNIDVDSTNLIFAYGSAIVLQDPGHLEHQQPFFRVSLLDSNGHILDSLCGDIQYFASATIPGFVQANVGSVVYRDWQYGGLDLTPYIDQQVTVEFTTKDCSLGGHYGYAYIDAGCYPKTIITQYCEGKTDTLRMTAPLGFDYLWSNGDTTQVLEQPLSILDSVYYVTCTSPLTGCSFELSATTEPTYYYGFDILENSCGDARLRTTIQISRNNIANYYWDFGDSTTLADTSHEVIPNYTYPAPGQYIVRLEVNDGLGCSSDTLLDTVNIYFPPIADFEAADVCLGDTTFIINQTDTSYNVNSFFLWNYGDGSPIDTNVNPFHIYGSDSFHLVTLIVWSDSMFCSDTIAKWVKVDDLPVAAFVHVEPDSCVPHEVHFVNLSRDGVDAPIDRWSWNFGDGATDAREEVAHVYTSPGVYSVSLAVQDTNGCADSIAQLNIIRVAPIPLADFEAYPTETHITTPEVVFTNRSSNADSYLWQFGDERNSGVGTSTEKDPVWEFKNAGVYVVHLAALSVYGCYDTASLMIHVIDDRLQLPNVITPNGDGMNDAFRFEGDHQSMHDFVCNIYNRWGQLVYQSNNPAFSWDGSLNGKYVPDGTYYYDIRYLGFEDREYLFQGIVQVLGH